MFCSVFSSEFQRFVRTFYGLLLGLEEIFGCLINGFDGV